MSLKWEFTSIIIIGICMLIILPLGVGNGIAVLSDAVGYKYWIILFLPLIILWVVLGLIYCYGNKI